MRPTSSEYYMRSTRTSTVPREAPRSTVFKTRTESPLTQMLAFNAATGKAFTIFFAGFALTMTTFPKTSRLPAFVAGFVRVFSLQRPGRVNTPVFLTSAVATLAMVSNILEHTVFFNSHSVANASARAPLVIALTEVFMAGAIALGDKYWSH